MENKAKEQIMNRLVNVLQGQGMIIREDTLTSTEDKLVQMDMVLDLIKFLQHYDENVKVLNEYWLNKKYQEKFNHSEPDTERAD